MPTGKEKQVEQPAEQPPEVETPIEEAQTEAPTEEIDWKAKAEQAEALAEEREKAYKGLQKVISRKDEQIKGKTIPPQPNQLEALELMATELEETGGGSARVVEIKRAIVAEKNRVAQEQYKQWQQSVVDEHTEEIETSLDANNVSEEDAKVVREALARCSQTGDFSRVYFKLAQVIHKGASKPEPIPVDNKKKEAEIKRRTMDEAGLLDTDVSSPAGASGSDEEFIKKFGAGEAASKEDFERAKKILSKL